MCAKGLTRKKPDKWIGYREKQDIINILDKIAEARGESRSSFFRSSVRETLDRILKEEVKPKHG